MDNWNKTRQDIGNRIEQLRTGKGLTQSDLAAEMTIALGRNISRETVKQWERGERDLKTEYTVALADFFGTNCDYLLRGINAHNTDISSALGLSDEAINSLRTINEDSFLQENAKPGLNRLLSSKGLPLFLLRLTGAFEFQDEVPSEDLVLRAYCASKNQNYTEYERLYFELIHDDLSDRVSSRDLFEYRAQKALLSIIRESESEAV